MPAFGYTAPTISKAEEMAERDALTTEERQLLQDEIYGRTVTATADLDFESSEKNDDHNSIMMTAGIQMVHQAIEALDEPDKVAYLEALEHVPALVQRESSVPAFLRATKFNAWAAARRVVDYWSTRKLLFGPNRAFLPMTLDGAMLDDVPYLQQGVVLVLPRDKQGRNVVFIDRVRCTPDVVPRDAVVRCWFYALQTLSETVVDQTRGYVTLSNYRVRILTFFLVWSRFCFKKYPCRHTLLTFFSLSNLFYPGLRFISQLRSHHDQTIFIVRECHAHYAQGQPHLYRSGCLGGGFDHASL